MHEKGDGVKHDIQEAVQLYNFGAAKGYAPSQFHLGLVYAKGEQVPRDFTIARNTWTAAAKQGM